MAPMEIRCPCGQVLRAPDEAELLSAAHRHVADRHPELVGRLADADLRRMARPAEDAG